MGNSPYSTLPSPNNGFGTRFVTVLFATVQLESSNPLCTSGKLSLNLHPVSFGTVTACTFALSSRRPIKNAPSLLTLTCAPFHVTYRTAGGATTVRGTLALRSPRSARVPSSIVALRTRYGPPTSTVVFVPNCQNDSNPETVFAVADLIGGAQNVAAVIGSAKRTSCEGDSQTVTNPADPGCTATFVMPAATEELVNRKRDEEQRAPAPVRGRANSCDWSASPKRNRTSRSPIVPAKKTEAVVKSREPFAPKV